MIETLHFFITPVATLLLALWAAWLSFAGEADAEMPRILADQEPAGETGLPPARALYVAHLALLVLAGAAAAVAESWWAWPPVGALSRLLLAVGLVWVVGSILPRFLAAVAPDLPGLARPSALHSLRLLAGGLRLVGRAACLSGDMDRQAARPTGAAQPTTTATPKNY